MFARGLEAEHLKILLFSDGLITGIEAAMVKGNGAEGGGASCDGSLGVGRVRKTVLEGVK